MKTALLVMTDGRRHLIQQTIPSALAMIKGDLSPRFIFDDSGNDEYRRWLKTNFPTFELIFKPTRQGFGGAIHSAWEHIKEYDFDYVFHLEDDFTFNREVDLEGMAKVLDENPNLYQVALVRQAWNSEEKRAGGIIQRWPTAFTQQDGWISHKMFFTTNPCLYRKSLLDIGWPLVPQSEGIFSHSLLNSNPDCTFGFWGQKTDKPWVHHIGDTRTGSGY